MRRPPDEPHTLAPVPIASYRLEVRYGPNAEASLMCSRHQPEEGADSRDWNATDELSEEAETTEVNDDAQG